MLWWEVFMIDWYLFIFHRCVLLGIFIQELKLHQGRRELQLQLKYLVDCCFSKPMDYRFLRFLLWGQAFGQLLTVSMASLLLSFWSRLICSCFNLNEKTARLFGCSLRIHGIDNFGFAFTGLEEIPWWFKYSLRFLFPSELYPFNYCGRLAYFACNVLSSAHA